MARKKARHRRAVFADMNKKLKKEVSAVSVKISRDLFYTSYGRALSVLTSFPISILSFSHHLFFNKKALVSLHQCLYVFMKDIFGFFNPQYGPLLCLLQLVCTNWSSNVLCLSLYLYVFQMSKLTRIQIQLEEQQPCFLRLTSVLLCL